MHTYSRSHRPDFWHLLRHNRSIVSSSDSHSGDQRTDRNHPRTAATTSAIVLRRRFGHLGGPPVLGHRNRRPGRFANAHGSQVPARHAHGLERGVRRCLRRSAHFFEHLDRIVGLLLPSHVGGVLPGDFGFQRHFDNCFDCSR
uniref:Uncharacterized protein n=1 Tax=Romanomermis culicivorax TaxID=13658 RepID=A0A915K5J4_ROMCU